MLAFTANNFFIQLLTSPAQMQVGSDEHRNRLDLLTKNSGGAAQYDFYMGFPDSH